MNKKDRNMYFTKKTTRQKYFVEELVLHMSLSTFSIPKEVAKSNYCQAIHFARLLKNQDGCTTDDGEPLHEKLRDRFGGLFMLAYILLLLGIFATGAVLMSPWVGCLR